MAHPTAHTRQRPAARPRLIVVLMVVTVLAVLFAPHRSGAQGPPSSFDSEPPSLSSSSTGPVLPGDASVPAFADSSPVAAQAVAQDLEGSAARFVNRAVARTAALYFTCFGIFLLVALTFLVCWRWMERDLPMLSVGLLALVMAGHTAAASGSLPFIFPTVVDVETARSVETATYLLVNGFVAFLLWAFFPGAFRPHSADWIATLNTTVAGAAVVGSIVFGAAVVVPGVEDAAILDGARWLTVPLMIVVAALAIQSAQADRPIGKLTAGGLALLVVGSIHDALFAGTFGRPYLVPFAVLGLVLLQAFVVLRRSAESSHTARLSSRRLRQEVEARTKELRAASVAAQAANMAKSEFVTAVTHELRTPLASLLGYVDLIRDEVRDDLAPEQLRFFESLELSAERMLNLVNNLLDLARIEAGRIDVIRRDVDVKRVVEDVRTQLYPIAHEKKLYLDTDVTSDETRVVTDEHWLNVVLTNLLSNAVKYTETGGVTIRIERASMGDRPALAVRVTDTGRGISDEFMPRLFHRFSRGEQARDDAPSGTGLGLTIARELLDHLGGRIEVESEVGAGSTFTVLLPVAGPEDAS